MYIIAYLILYIQKHAKCNVYWLLIGSCPLISVHFSIQDVSFQVKEKPITHVPICWLALDCEERLHQGLRFSGCGVVLKLQCVQNVFNYSCFYYSKFHFNRWKIYVQVYPTNCLAHKRLHSKNSNATGAAVKRCVNVNLMKVLKGFLKELWMFSSKGKSRHQGMEIFERLFWNELSSNNQDPYIMHLTKL